jgi:hypothetical protein
MIWPNSQIMGYLHIETFAGGLGNAKSQSILLAIT